MGRNKIKKFAENEQSEYIIQEGKEIFKTIKGNWKSDYFKNNNEVVLEVGCGGGDYSLGMARLFPNKNFIGSDIKGSRLFKGMTLAKDEGLTNIGFLRTQLRFIEDFFEGGEISELWITFPDPRPRDRDEKKRLTNIRFLNLYKKILASDGYVYFKTDDKPLFEFTLEELKKTEVTDLIYTFDLYEDKEMLPLALGLKTHYEKMFLEMGRKIHLMRFKFASSQK